MKTERGSVTRSDWICRAPKCCAARFLLGGGGLLMLWLLQIPMTHTTRAAADFVVVLSNEDDFHSGFHHFADKVNRKLKAGYRLHGQPFNINQVLCQAMVREEGPAHSGDTVYFHKPVAVNH